MFKILFNLVLGYIIYVYAIKPFIRGFFNIDNNDNIQQNTRKTQQNDKKNDDYSDYEEV
jgi:hypothetical protein